MFKQTAAKLAVAVATSMPPMGQQAAIEARANGPREVLVQPRRTPRAEQARRKAEGDARITAAAAKRARRAIKATRDWERQEAGQRWRRHALGG